MKSPRADEASHLTNPSLDTTTTTLSHDTPRCDDCSSDGE